LCRCVERIEKRDDGGFEVSLAASAQCSAATVAGFISCDKLLLATGGARTTAQGQLAVALGHTLETPVPSLFTFHVETPWLRRLAGVSVETVEVSVPETKLRERGPSLVTHWGLSGPATLRLSAWGARELHKRVCRAGCDNQLLPKPRVRIVAVDQELDILDFRATCSPA
jgi:predicted flavoprotein YhiN